LSPVGTIKFTCYSKSLIYYILINNGEKSYYIEIQLVPKTAEARLNSLSSPTIA